MELINLITADSKMKFTQTYYFINIYNADDPYIKDLSFEIQTLKIKEFQQSFEEMTTNASFESLISLLPYFSWTDEFWDMNFMYRSALERFQDAKELSTFYSLFAHRENEIVENLHSRLPSTVTGPKGKMYITYFPKTKDPMRDFLDSQRLHETLITTIERVSQVGVANAWLNLLPLFDENYDDTDILQKVTHEIQKIAPSERQKLSTEAKKSPFSGVIKDLFADSSRYNE